MTSHATDVLESLARDIRSHQRALGMLVQRRAAERAAARGDEGLGLEPDADCPVCFEVLARPQAVLTACGHMFHRDCMAKVFAVERDSRCPMCRKSVCEAGLRPIMNGLPEGVAETSTDVFARSFASETVGWKGSVKGEHVEEIVDLTSDCTTVKALGLRGRRLGGRREMEREVESLRAKEKEIKRVREKENAANVLDEKLAMALARMSYLCSETERLSVFEENVRESARKAEEDMNNMRIDLELDKEEMKKEFEAEKMRYRRKMTVLDTEKGELDAKRAAVCDEIAAYKQRLSSLEIERKRMVVREAELVRKGEALDGERAAILAKKERLVSLMRATKEKKAGRPDVVSNEMLTLKHENACLRKQLRKLRGLDPLTPSPTSLRHPALRDNDNLLQDQMLQMSDKSASSEDDDIVGTVNKQYERNHANRKRQKVSSSLPAKSPTKNDRTANDVFGELRPPKPGSWPVAPRAMRAPGPVAGRAGARLGVKSGGGLAQFAPTRAPPQRPLGGVATKIGKSSLNMSMSPVGPARVSPPKMSRKHAIVAGRQRTMEQFVARKD